MRVRRDSRLRLGERFSSYTGVQSARYVHLIRNPRRAPQSGLVTRADNTLRSPAQSWDASPTLG